MYELTETQTALVERFAKGEARSGESAGGFRVIGRGKTRASLVYRGREKGSQVEELLATFVPNGRVRYPISNAAELRYANTQMVYGERTAEPRWRSSNNGERAVQRALRESGAIPIPFNALEEAGLKPRQVHIIEKGPAEQIVERVIDNGETKQLERHFVGACLFEATGVGFLFDLDRRELGFGRLNSFIVQLPSPVAATIAQAYESLKPQAVRDAEAKDLVVLRQGEWFFIPVNREPLVNLVVANRMLATLGRPIATATELAKRMGLLGWNSTVMRALQACGIAEGQLQAGENRPNSVEQLVREADGSTLVKGQVYHTGREHEPLVLESWHRVVPNTATKSWTVTGRVD